MPMTPREMIKHLKKNGFEVVSQNGSHVKMRNDATDHQTVIPYHSASLKNRRGLNSSAPKLWRL